MATGKLRYRKTRAGRNTGVREGRPTDEYRAAGNHERSLWQLAVLFAVLVSSQPVCAQDEGAAPGPLPSAPTTAAPETEEGEAEEEEEEEEEERRALPFLFPEPSLTDTLMPDARPDLNSSVLFPPNALEGLRRPERPLQVGDFAISPGVEVAAAYDNIHPRDGDSSHDVTGSLGASVRARSLFERHSLGFGVDAAISNPQRSPGNTTPDRFALTSRADGRLDLTRRSALSAEARFARGAQNPEAEEAGAEDEPTILTAAGALAYEQRFNRLGWQFAGGVNRREADDGDEAAEQDRTRYTVSPSANYRISRRLSLFADSGYSIYRYDQSGEGGSRDSQTVRADVGTEIGFGRTFSARLGIGYLGVFFEDSERKDRHEPAVTAELNGAIGISVDRLTSLRLGINHSTEQTTADDAALVTRTQGFASIGRPITRDSAVLGRLRLIRSDFVDDSRTDHDIVAELGYSHTLLRNVALNLGYRFRQRFSNSSENEFYRNTVSVGLSASF